MRHDADEFVAFAQPADTILPLAVERAPTPTPGRTAAVATEGELVVLTQQAEAYRALALAGVHELAKVTRERDTARAACAGMREELRTQRAEIARYTASQVGRTGRAA